MSCLHRSKSEQLDARELDVGLLRLPLSMPLPSNLVFTPLLEEPLLLAMHAAHPLTKATSSDSQICAASRLSLIPGKRG